MPKTRDLLKDVSVEMAQRKRKCHRNSKKHSIAAGHRCLVVRDPSTGYPRNYCLECAQPILERLKMRLTEVESALYPSSPTEVA